MQHGNNASHSLSPFLRSVISAHPALSQDAEVRLTTSIADAHAAAWAACLGPECVRESRRAALLTLAARGHKHADALLPDATAMPFAEVATLAARCRAGLDNDQDLLRAVQAAALTECDDVRTSPRSSASSVARAEKWRARILATAATLARLEDRMVRHNLGLVTLLASQRRSTAVAFDDLVQQGTLGLLAALRRFDISRGFRFSTYSVWWVRHYIGRYIDDNDRTVRLPVHLKTTIGKIRRADAELYNTATCTPASDEQVAAHLDLTSAQMQRARVAMQSNLSLDAQPTSHEHEGQALGVNLVAPNPDPADMLDDESLTAKVHAVVPETRPMTRDAFIVASYFGLHGEEPITHLSAGKLVGLSRERARQICDLACRRMRPSLAAFA